MSDTTKTTRPLAPMAEIETSSTRAKCLRENVDAPSPSPRAKVPPPVRWGNDASCKPQWWHELLYCSRLMADLVAQLRILASAESTICIEGETGTGKKLVAKGIHAESQRCRGPFVSINCSTLPETLIESVLFGHVRGAFTSADRDQKGLFELAHCGTLFFDELGELPARLQPKLLTVLEDGYVRPVGSEKKVPVNVRIIAATNRSLVDSVNNGTFRGELFYRLAVLPVELPPLRERPEDIALLLDHFLEKQGLKDRLDQVLTPAALTFLQRYRWPGNVRELDNFAVRVMHHLRFRPVFEQSDVEGILKGVAPKDIPVQAVAASTEEIPRKRPGPKPREIDWGLVRMWHEAQQTVKSIAQKLGISRATLYARPEFQEILRLSRVSGFCF